MQNFYVGLYFSEQFKTGTHVPHKMHVIDLGTFVPLDMAWL
jgi:hypothetical protein